MQTALSGALAAAERGDVIGVGVVLARTDGSVATSWVANDGALALLVGALAVLSGRVTKVALAGRDDDDASD